jgi:hypothetical protein
LLTTPNRSTDDSIAFVLHTALSLLDKKNTYVRMLFIDYSSAFDTIVSSKLIIKLGALGLNPALCNWVLDFLTVSMPDYQRLRDSLEESSEGPGSVVPGK